MMATVEDPIEVLKSAAKRNGKMSPRPCNRVAWAVMTFVMSEEAITLPSTPPAAVIKSIGPTVFKVSPVNWLNRLPLPDLYNRYTAKHAPTVRAMTGGPRTSMTSATVAGTSKSLTTEAADISKIGTRMGATDSQPPGNEP